MKHYTVLILLLVLFSCGKDKSVLLPEIKNAPITEVLDISPAYIFYDETQPDGVKLNRKNLIGTTNWLFNVDKRLTLEQAIPKIQFLQDKKRNAQMHKNENAKNYYTCNDTIIKNLGFIEFTDVHYQNTPLRDFLNHKAQYEKMSLALNVITAQNFTLEVLYNETIETKMYSSAEDVIKAIKEYSKIEESLKLYLVFQNELSFQNYITIKSELLGLESEAITIDNNEFIY